MQAAECRPVTGEVESWMRQRITRERGLLVWVRGVPGRVYHCAWDPAGFRPAAPTLGWTADTACGRQLHTTAKHPDGPPGGRVCLVCTRFAHRTVAVDDG